MPIRAPRPAREAREAVSVLLKAPDVLFRIVEVLLPARALAMAPACTFPDVELADDATCVGPLLSSACMVALNAPVRPVMLNL